MRGRDKAFFERESHELGFIRDTFEKTCRIVDFLGLLAGDDILRGFLALKGGTAVNLAVLNLPRLSVDVDLDLIEDVGRDELPALRTEISGKIENYMCDSGYRLSDKKSKYSHALDSFVYEYTNSGGMKDYVKIEID